MFEGVRGKGLKDFFKSRKGRKLSFASNEPVKIKAGVDMISFDAYNNPNNLCIIPDVIIDFSNPAALDSMLAFATCDCAKRQTRQAKLQLQRQQSLAKGDCTKGRG